MGYAKLKKKTHKKTRKRIKSLLNLLKRGIDTLQALLDTGQLAGELDKPFYQYLRTIKQVLLQQRYLYQHPGNRVPNRIVSLHKPYVRPIKRGKENKPTEFGPKVHMMQVDGLSFIEYLNFNAFNECKRLKISVVKHKILFEECRQVSTDKIYATNENRRFCTQQGIFTNFIPKGPLLKDQSWAKTQKRLKSDRRSGSPQSGSCFSAGR